MSKIDYEDNESANSLGAKVYVQIQDDILNGKYRPGDSLKETKLSSEMGVSRTPIREAIRQLELEGLVRSIPNKGAIVKGISQQDIKDIYTIRTLIEGLAARRAAENITPRELEELEETVQLEEFYTKRNDIAHLIKLDTRFHEILFRASKSLPLVHTLSTFHHYVQKARVSSMETSGRPEQVLIEHKAILQSIAEGDAEKAEKLTTQHVKNASMSLDR